MFIKLAMLALVAFPFLSHHCVGLGSEAAHPNFQWRIAGRLPIEDDSERLGLAGAVVGVSDGALIVGGGANFPHGRPWNGGVKAYHDAVYVFVKKSGSVASLPQRYRLPAPMAYGASTTTSEGVVVVGGENEHGPLRRAMLLRWDAAHDRLAIKKLPGLPLRLSSGSLTSANNVVYFVGGNGSSSTSNRFFSLNLKHLKTGWKKLPNAPVAVSHALLVTTYHDSKPIIYLIGGRKRIPDHTSKFYNLVYEYDVDKGTWKKERPLPYPLSAETGIVWQHHFILVFSGDQGRTFHQTQRVMLKIAHAGSHQYKQRLIDIKHEVQKYHPYYPSTILAYNTLSNKWSHIGNIPFPGQVTTTAVKWGDGVVIPSGEIRAGVRSPFIVVGAPTCASLSERQSGSG